ncbi:uncharacterized protein LOC133493633 isoform X8 [Syngnathoides biaculeatus]|uniref:uncharacterized protein LOC133493633 isoform X8 n=1 Tax=Syngnathoides biaculeatus TaxID=300417 RepID=UPI002ADE6F3D|nr:uncharacterized protein LOC133493633 isoform X8 [Syngnathoides biaculeatus]
MCHPQGHPQRLMQFKIKCCDGHVKMCARMSGEYKEEVCGPKEEEEPQHQLLDTVFNLQPQIVLRRADITEELHTKWSAPDHLHIKEEMEDEEVQHIKEEEEPISIKKEDEKERLHIKQEEEDITKFPSTCVPLKSEDEGQSEESRGAELLRSSSSQHMTTESDENHDGGSRPDRLMAPLYDHGDMTSDSPNADDNEQCKGRVREGV